MSDDEFVGLVADVVAGRTSPETLVELLSEGSRLYAGRGAGEVARRRGWIMAAFEHAGLPDAALPCIFEELDTARDPYVTAGAAKALRGTSRSDATFADHLAAAWVNMRERDDAVSFEAFRPDWTIGRSTTALTEILATLRSLGRVPEHVLMLLRSERGQPGGLSRAVRAALADVVDHLEPMVDAGATPAVPACCGGTTEASPACRSVGGRAGLAGVELEDQNGRRIALDDFVRDRPTVIAFFYTRCDNPHKCSLTVSKMAQLQRRLEEHGRSGDVQLALLSYDSPYDTPPRLARYGAARGFVPNDRHRLMRVTDGDDRLRERLALNVGFIGSLVNRHALELFLTQPRGGIAATWQRVQWDIDEVLTQAVAIADEHRPSLRQ